MQLSLPKLWQVWERFRTGKHPSAEIDVFQGDLEENLASLHRDLIARHSPEQLGWFNWLVKKRLIDRDRWPPLSSHP